MSNSHKAPSFKDHGFLGLLASKCGARGTPNAQLASSAGAAEPVFLDVLLADFYTRPMEKKMGAYEAQLQMARLIHSNPFLPVKPLQTLVAGDHVCPILFTFAHATKPKVQPLFFCNFYELLKACPTSKCNTNDSKKYVLEHCSKSHASGVKNRFNLGSETR